MKKELADYKQVFSNARSRANKSGVGWILSFDEWIEWWGDDIDRIGTGQNDLRMVRISDKEPFSIHNIRKVDAIQFGKIISAKRRNRASFVHAEENAFRKDAMVYSASKEIDNDHIDDNEPLFDRTMLKRAAFLIDKRR